MNTRTHTDWLTTEEIESPLRQMAGDSARISGKWIVDQFKIGLGDGLGTWRVEGTMSTAQGEQRWSLVLKGWNCECKSGSPSARDWPWREADLYGSGALNDLPGVHAPKCFGTVQREDLVWVWLEDLTVVPQPLWTLEHYAAAARNLGQFNGTCLDGHPLSSHPSLSRQWLAKWTAANTETMANLDRYLDHPFVQRMVSADVLAAFRHIWDQRQRILDDLAAMPQTICHLDAFHRNTFLRNVDGHEDMVLIDWSFAGWAAVGEELASLCVAGVGFDPRTPDNIEEVGRVAYGAYIEGLSEAGWKGNDESVWHAYRSAGMLRYGPASLHKSLPMVSNDALWAAVCEAMGVPFGRAQDHVVAASRWIAACAEDL